VQDALGVVEPVDAEQQDLRLAERLPDLPRALPDLLPPRDLAQRLRVDGDRERLRPHLARPVGPHGLPPGRQPRGPAAGAQEVRGVGAALEPEQVRAEQALDHLPPPGKLGEDLVAGERYVVEEADAQVLALLAEHPRHQLHLVVVHPHGRAVRGLLGRRLGERPVDRHVGVPPLAMKLRLRDHVVVERPQGGVAEALVEVPELLGGQAHPHQVQAVRVEPARRRAGVAGPPDPHPPGLVHDRPERGDQAARARPPARRPVRPVRLLDPVHRQPAGHHHEIMIP
jgi:hypothetical protein